MASGGPRWRQSLVAGVIGLLAGAAGVGSYYALSRGDMSVEVREALLEHPEIIPEAMERLQQRENAAAVDRHRAELETPFHSAWAGAPDGDVVLVEFFDYACGYCRASNPDVERLLAEDPRLKVVWRELPVLGPDSEQAALASMAAAKAGRFRDFHSELFEQGRPTADAIQRASAAVDIGPAEVTDEFRAEISKNIALARTIRASGTPTFVIGDQVLQGAVGYQALKDAIAEARADRS